MQISKREFLKKLGLGGIGLVTGKALGDVVTSAEGKIPSGSIGDPKNPQFAKYIFPLPHTIEDGESASMKDGRVFLPGREVPVFHTTDVLVVGGGPAGFAAAIAAAKTGAKVALVEKDGSLGGLFTNGMVLIMLASSKREADGSWTLVTRGVCGEFMNRAEALGPRAALKRSQRNCNQPTVDPEAAKYLMDRMAEENKVEVFFHAWGMDVIQDGNKVRGVVFMSKQGFQAILAKQVVDATGDGDIYFAAGADYRQISHGIGFVARFANMDRVTGKRPPAAAESAAVPGPWPTRSNEGNPATCWTGMPNHKGDGLSIRDLTREEIYHRKALWEHVAAMQKTPGWEDVYLANTCSQIGPRVTRLLKSELVVDRAMIEKMGMPSDVVGWFGWDSSIHPEFPVPYRALLPVGVDNLLAAGRSIGAPDTCDTFRLICPCFVTGEAAGTAAALAAKMGVRPRDLDVRILQRTLLSGNVYLGV